MNTVPPVSALDLRVPITREGDGALKAPDNAIVYESSARAIYAGLYQQHVNRVVTYSAIEGLISGNPPYSAVELQRAGLGHLTNFNDLTARSLYERTAQMYWNLFQQCITLATFTLKYPGELGRSPNLPIYAAKLGEHFSAVMKEWLPFTTVMGTLTSQIVKFGVSPVHFPDEQSWEFEVVDLARFYVPNEAESRLDKISTFAINTKCTVQYLFQCYEDASKNDSPWNEEALSWLLIQVANNYGMNNNGQQTQSIDIWYLQQQYQNGSATWSGYFNQVVPLISMFQVEYDGKVTQMKFHPTIQCNVSTEEPKKQFIFYEDRQYESIADALMVFTRSPGEMQIHGNRGLGHMIYSASIAKMQLDCSAVDMAKLGASPIISDTLPGTNRDADAITFRPGVFNNIGPRKAEIMSVGTSIQQSMGLSQNIAASLERNAMNSGDDPGVPDRSNGSLSPDQTKFKAYKEFGIFKFYVNHFYSQLDRMYQTIVARMLHSKATYGGYDLAKEWKDRCLDDGVPEEIFETGKTQEGKLPKHMRVEASRVAGSGSQMGLMMGLQDIAPFMGSLPAKAQRPVQVMAVTAAFGPEFVPVLTQSEVEAAEEEGGSTIAGLENNQMSQGQEPVFSADNNQQAHFVTHLALANQTIQQIQQGQITPVQGDQILGICVPHMQQHWAVLKANIFAKQFVLEMEKPFNQIIQYAQLNRKNANAQLKAQIQKQAELEERRQEMLTEDSIERERMVREQGRKDVEAERKNERTVARDEVASESIRKKTDAQVAKIAAETAAKNQKEQAEVAAIQNKSAAEMSATEAKARLKANSGKTPSPNDLG